MDLLLFGYLCLCLYLYLHPHVLITRALLGGSIFLDPRRALGRAVGPASVLVGASGLCLDLHKAQHNGPILLILGYWAIV